MFLVLQINYNNQTYKQSNMKTVPEYLHHLVHHLDTLTLKGLTPSAKQEIQKFLDEKNNTHDDTGIWAFTKYTLISIFALSLLFCLIYSIYQWCKNRSPQFQPSPTIAGYGGYGAYQQNFPVMAAPPQFGQYGQYGQAGGQFNQFAQMQGGQFNQFAQMQGGNYGGANLLVGAGAGYGGYQDIQRGYNQPAQIKSPKLKQAKDRDLIQSVTWKLDTQGKGR